MSLQPADTYAAFLLLHILHYDAAGLEPQTSILLLLTELDEARKTAVLGELVEIGAIRSDNGKWRITDYGEKINKDFSARSFHGD
ncbi:MAG: hypothetical protein KDA17_07505 [Candidatus Saccharibacteria bacterium]|nr:hypothetical protein [Candidatus Saccharibacteria bacterium]